MAKKKSVKKKAVKPSRPLSKKPDDLILSEKEITRKYGQLDELAKDENLVLEEAVDPGVEPEVEVEEGLVEVPDKEDE